MSWLMILIEAVVFLGLFTAMVMIPAIKNPVLGVHNYPPEIQEAYFKTHPRIETAPLSKRTILIKSAGIVMFAAVLTAGHCWLERTAFGTVLGSPCSCSRQSALMTPSFWTGFCLPG